MTAIALDVTAAELAIVRAVLQQIVPGREVWAFGSRVHGGAKKFSDLDLVVGGEEPLPLGVMAELRDAFSESDLPWRVDLVDWASASQSFRDIVEHSRIETLVSRGKTE